MGCTLKEDNFREGNSLSAALFLEPVYVLKNVDIRSTDITVFMCYTIQGYKAILVITSYISESSQSMPKFSAEWI